MPVFFTDIQKCMTPGVWLNSFLTIIFLVFPLAMLVSCDVWLSLLTKTHPEDQKNETNLVIYGSLVGASFIFLIIRAFSFYLVSLRCSERLHDKMVAAVLQAPVVFFDSNPVGRIMNRFSKDISCMDDVLPKTFLRAIQRTLLMFTSILLPTVINPWLLFALTPIAVLAGVISRYYLKTSRELQRLESVSRSPVFSHFSETLDGLDNSDEKKRKRFRGWVLQVLYSFLLSLLLNNFDTCILNSSSLNWVTPGLSSQSTGYSGR